MFLIIELVFLLLLLFYLRQRRKAMARKILAITLFLGLIIIIQGLSGRRWKYGNEMGDGRYAAEQRLSRSLVSGNYILIMCLLKLEGFFIVGIVEFHHTIN